MVTFNYGSSLIPDLFDGMDLMGFLFVFVFFFNFQKKDLRSCSREQRSLSVHYSYAWTPLLVERSTRVEIKYEEIKIA